MYHNINNFYTDRYVTTPASFEKQLKLIRALRYQTMTLSQICSMVINRQPFPPTIVLTFDDGYLDNYQFALPLLLKYNMKATVFTVAGWVGRDTDWDDKRGRQFRQMGWSELRDWVRHGMEVGSHTINHLNLPRISAEETLRDEIFGSKQILEDGLQLPILSFGYPYGRFDDRVKEKVQQAGYLAAVSTLPGVAIKAASDVYALPRYEINPQLHIVKLAYRLVI